jgi:hypothetical protein
MAGNNEDKWQRAVFMIIFWFPGFLLPSKLHVPGILDYLPAIFQLKPLDDLTHVVLDGVLGQEQFCPHLFIG